MNFVPKKLKSYTLVIFGLVVLGFAWWISRPKDYYEDYADASSANIDLATYEGLEMLPQTEEQVSDFMINTNPPFVADNGLFELVGVPNYDVQSEAYNLSIGCGQGIWGTAGSRPESSMIGN